MPEVEELEPTKPGRKNLGSKVSNLFSPLCDDHVALFRMRIGMRKGQFTLKTCVSRVCTSLQDVGGEFLEVNVLCRKNVRTLD